MSPWNFDRHFTIEEANQLVGWLRDRFFAIHTLTGYHCPLWKSHSGETNGNGAHQRFISSPANFSAEEKRKLAEAHLGEIEQKGIIVRDWRRGLVDFPSIINGQEVFLCYELADGNAVLFYHGLNEGYGGRKLLGEMSEGDHA